MELFFDNSLTINYRSATQIARVMTESWVEKNMFCPRCGNLNLKHFENNRPVADFFCPVCNNEYELKSKNGIIGKKINDGAYDTMIERILSNNNPDFFFMSYSKTGLQVKDFIFIPKHFFVPDVIEKRTPLAAGTRRAGWVGCNILLEKIPQQGRITIISGGSIANRNSVVAKVRQSDSLRIANIDNRGWLFDILSCINKFCGDEFTLKELYEFENILHQKHPDNNNIKPKIRQQLQFLRDRGFIDFTGKGRYKLIKNSENI